MDRNLIREALWEVLQDEAGLSWDACRRGVHLANDLGLDSVDQVGLLMQIERQFRIRFTHVELNELATSEELCEAIAVKLEQQSGSRAA